jgi:hypothetical protein
MGWMPEPIPGYDAFTQKTHIRLVPAARLNDSLTHNIILDIGEFVSCEERQIRRTYGGKHRMSYVHAVIEPLRTYSSEARSLLLMMPP